MRTSEAQQRSIDYILSRWGKLGDLPNAVVPVIWVTTLRSMETILKAEAVGGEEGVIRDQLQGGRLGLDLKIAYQKMKLLEKIITGLRAEKVLARRKADVSLFVDILKWGIEDAADRTRISRVMARLTTKADPYYALPVPPEVTEW